MAYDKDKVFDIICDRISNGESLRSVLRDDAMPERSTVYEWLKGDESKSNQYARATNDRADAIFDEMFEIADDGTNDTMTVSIGEGLEVEKLNTEHIQRSRLRIDTRKWALSKMNPKKYGDRITQEIDDKRDNRIEIEIVNPEKGGLEISTPNAKS